MSPGKIVRYVFEDENGRVGKAAVGEGHGLHVILNHSVQNPLDFCS